MDSSTIASWTSLIGFGQVQLLFMGFLVNVIIILFLQKFVPIFTFYANIVDPDQTTHSMTSAHLIHILLDTRH